MVKLTKLLSVLAMLLISLTSQAANQAATKERIVVFVPGFFNSFAPEYFSVDITRTMQAKGFYVVIAEKLNPIGTIEDNGKRVLNLFKTIHAQHPKAEINVIGHSAGGLYSLYAINQGADYIKTLITVSTPFNGIEFVENWIQNSHLFKELMNFSHLDGLRQLTSPFVQKFLSTIRVHSQLKMFAFGGYQPTSYDVWDAANMSAILSVTDSFIKGPSDGIVSFQSALTDTWITTTQKTVFKIKTYKNYFIPLEHWEQVLDYRHFILLGSRNIGLIRKRQIQFYSGIADFINEL